MSKSNGLNHVTDNFLERNTRIISNDFQLKGSAEAPPVGLEPT